MKQINKTDPNFTMTAIRSTLIETFSPEYLSLENEGHRHIGHAGALSGGGHYALEISAAVFKELSLLSCHRLIYQSLKNFMQKEIHALRIKIIL